MFFLNPKALPIFIVLSLTSLLLTLLFTSFWKKTNNIEDEQINKIKKEFNKRFNRELGSITDLDAVRKNIDRQISEKHIIQKMSENIERDIRILISEIRHDFELLGYKENEENSWLACIRSIKEDLRKDNELKNKYINEFNILDLGKSDFLKKPSGIEYSKMEERKLESEIDDIDLKIDAEKEKLNDLIKVLSEHIGYEIASSGDMESIAGELEKIKSITKNELINLFSTITAGHIVSNVIADFQKDEDEKLEDYINDNTIIDLVRRFTNKYDTLSIDDNEIFIGNDNESYNLKDVSSGAQEQILLALRMGIALKLTGKENLFLILDDAFQYSDWTRRGYLVDKVKEIVNYGWQVLYFTMDDDIRDRFVAIGKEMGDELFSLIELKQA